MSREVIVGSYIRGADSSCTPRLRCLAQVLGALG